VTIKKRTETFFRMSRHPVIQVVKNRVQLRHLFATTDCCLPVITAMPDTGHDDNIKANALDAVTLLATPAGLNLARPPFQRG
jgi:hypothetical protein